MGGRRREGEARRQTDTPARGLRRRRALMNASIAGAHKNKTVTPFRIMLKEGLCSTRTHKHTHTYTHTHTHTAVTVFLIMLKEGLCGTQALGSARTHARTHAHTHTHTHTHIVS